MEGQGPHTPGSGDPEHHMPPPPPQSSGQSGQPTAQPPAQPPGQPPGPPPSGYTIPAGLLNLPTGARMTVPGNAEWALWFCVEILFAIIWASSDAVDASTFVLVTAIVTFAYLISRGIAKASRVLEH